MVDIGIKFDASKSNPIYGSSTTVQPASALLIPYVKAFAGASADSTDLAITEVANDVARLSANIVGKNECKSYVVESVVNDDGSWYRKYSDGWLEQGGFAIFHEGGPHIVNLLKPYANTSYIAIATMSRNTTLAGGTDAASDIFCGVFTQTTTSISCGFAVNYLNELRTSGGIRWVAFGMEA